MPKKIEPVSDEYVKVKISRCQTCKKAVRFSIEHAMTPKMKNEFSKEVMKYNLSVESIPLEEFRASSKEMCDCK